MDGKYFRYEDGYIYSAFNTVTNEDDVEEYLDERDRFVTSSGTNLRFITDLREAPMLNSQLRNKIAERLKYNSNLIQRNGMVCDSKIKAAAISVMITFTGRKNMKVFLDMDKAIAWIKE